MESNETLQVEWEVIEDEYGTWKIREGMKLLVERSQKYIDENPPQESEPTPPTDIELLQQENLILQLALAETIEKQETDKINNQIALAELLETLIIKGVL